MIKEYLNSHYSFKKPMVLKDNKLLGELLTTINHTTYIPGVGLTDVEYVTDLIGVDVYLSFYPDNNLNGVKNYVPENTLFLFADKFFINKDGDIDIRPEISGIYTDKILKQYKTKFKRNNIYIYDIH